MFQDVCSVCCLFHFSPPQSVDASALGVTEFLDYTGGVRAVIDETLSDLPNSTRQCCKYRYQMLDQYCATREGVRVS